MQNSENETWEQCKRNMKYGNWEISGETEEGEWTNWRGTSGQTGGAPRSALAATKSDLPKFWQCPGLVHVPQNPIMYDMWGGTGNIFSARSLWSKIPRSQGVRSPDWHSCQTGNQTRWHLIPAWHLIPVQIQKKTKFLLYLRLKTWSCFEQITILQYNTALLNVVWPKESVLKVVFT